MSVRGMELLSESLIRLEKNLNLSCMIMKYENNFYCCTVHFDNIKILFTNKYSLLLNT